MLPRMYLSILKGGNKTMVPASSNLNLELQRELWMWRGFTILMLIILIVSNVATYLSDVKQHAKDNTERAAAWTRIELGVKSNTDNLSVLHRQLSDCMRCHAHAIDMNKQIGR